MVTALSAVNLLCGLDESWAEEGFSTTKGNWCHQAMSIKWMRKPLCTNWKQAWPIPACYGVDSVYCSEAMSKILASCIIIQVEHIWAMHSQSPHPVFVSLQVSRTELACLSLINLVGMAEIPTWSMFHLMPLGSRLRHQARSHQDAPLCFGMPQPILYSQSAVSALSFCKMALDKTSKHDCMHDDKDCRSIVVQLYFLRMAEFRSCLLTLCERLPPTPCSATNTFPTRWWPPPQQLTWLQGSHVQGGRSRELCWEYCMPTYS